MNKYIRKLTDKDGVTCNIDVYDVLSAFNVTCPATQHAVKKLLCTGMRGHKDTATDLKEANESIERAIELLSQNQDIKLKQAMNDIKKESNHGN